MIWYMVTSISEQHTSKFRAEEMSLCLPQFINS